MFTCVGSTPVVGTTNHRKPLARGGKIADHSTNGPRKFSKIAERKMKGCDVKRKLKKKKI